MAEILENGHELTVEDIDTAKLIIELDQRLNKLISSLVRRIANTPIEDVKRDGPASTQPDVKRARELFDELQSSDESESSGVPADRDPGLRGSRLRVQTHLKAALEADCLGLSYQTQVIRFTSKWRLQSSTLPERRVIY